MIYSAIFCQLHIVPGMQENLFSRIMVTTNTSAKLLRKTFDLYFEFDHMFLKS